MSAARLASGVWVLSVALLAVGGLAGATGPAVPERPSEPAVIGLAFAVVVLGYITVGAMVAARRPHNPLGWIFLGLGGAMALATASDGYAAHALFGGGSGLPAAQMSAWLADFVISGPGILFGSFVFVFLLFPTGRLPSPRWRAVAWAAAVVSAGLQLVATLQPGPLPGFPTVTNPLGVAGSVGALEPALYVALLLLLAASATSALLRFRRAAGEERLQLKWFAAAAAFLGITIVTAPAWWLSEAEIAAVMWPLQFAAGLIGVPVACAVAILRYRLYDIDRLVSRTVTYALLTGVLAAVYLAGVLALSRVLAPLAGGGSELAVAGATLAVAAVFSPARTRIQAVVDRRFNRDRYDAQRELEAFRGRLRGDVDLGQISDDVLAVVLRTVQPIGVSVWFVPGGGPR